MRNKIALTFGLFISGLAFGKVAVPQMPTISDADRKEWLGLIDQENHKNLGFATFPEHMTIGEGIAVAEIANGFYDNDLAPKTANIEGINKFVFPISVNGEVKSLIVMTRDTNAGPFTIESVGYDILAQKIDKILTAANSSTQDLVLVEDLYTDNIFAIKNSDDLVASSQIIAFSSASIYDEHRFPMTMTLEQYRASRIHLKDINVRSLGSHVPSQALPNRTVALPSTKQEPTSKECKRRAHTTKRSYEVPMDMEKFTIRDWQDEVRRKFGQSWSEWKLAKKSNISCKSNPDKKSKYLHICTAKATPCQEKDGDQMEERQLRIRNFDQQQSKWCWAAVSQSILNFVSRKSIGRQCEIANLGLKRDDCCNSPLPKECNQGNYLSTMRDDIWAHYNVAGTFLFDPHTYEEIKTNINNNRPAVINWQFEHKNLGHFVFYSGYRDGRTNVIFVNDPSQKKGNAWLSYDKVALSGKRAWDSSLTAQRR